MQFRDFDIDAFLRDHWQKKPLLIRNPWEDWHNPLAPDELAGLACEVDMESRLVTRSSGNWQLEHGPLPESKFASLGAELWTLLVQAVDVHVPDVAALLEPFRFIPSWRVDDVMVSYATDKGGVGPHFDQYDVFLIQGLGKRRWQIGVRCDDTVELLPHDELRLLTSFEVVDEWIVEPGDILYIPPGFAHDGVAVGDNCMTYSIGFRAPSRGELIGDWSDDLLEKLPDDDRYQDPDLVRQQNPGEISTAAIAKVHAMILQKLDDRAAFTRWFGEYSSTPKYPEMDWRPNEPITVDGVRAQLASGTSLLRNPASRFSFARQDSEAIWLFVDGLSFACDGDTRAFAETISAHAHLTNTADFENSPTTWALIATLINQGSLTFDQGD